MTYFMTKQWRSNIPHVDRAPYSTQCSGEEGRGWRRGTGVSAVISLGAHFKATLATHSRAVFQRFAAAATRFTWLHLNLASSAPPSPTPSHDACVLACYLRLWDKAACDPLGQKKKKRCRRQKKQEAWRSCDISGKSPIGQESPAAISKPQLPPSPSTPPRNLRSRAKMKNEEYYDFTHSCQKDINRIQLRRRLDTEILLCAVNKRPAPSRRAALMQCYEGGMYGEADIHTLGSDLTLLSWLARNE